MKLISPTFSKPTSVSPHLQQRFYSKPIMAPSPPPNPLPSITAPLKTAHVNPPVQIPRFVYGTAWKKDRTTELVFQALRAGFTGVDTAAQPRHYSEELVGAGIRKALDDDIIKREDIHVQPPSLTIYSPSIAHRADHYLVDPNQIHPSFRSRPQKPPIFPHRPPGDPNPHLGCLFPQESRHPTIDVHRHANPALPPFFPMSYRLRLENDGILCATLHPCPGDLEH